MSHTVLLCTSCDAIRDQERCFCANCGEATDSYAYEPSEREAYTLSQVEAEELALQFGFQREPHTGLIYLGEDRRAA
jgi:hypothetical protein